MEEKIKRIVKKEFNAEASEIKVTSGGFSHNMYLVAINKRPNELIIRFSNNKDKEVNLAKEKYIIDLMAKHNIPVPKVYAFDNSKKDIPEEYMILEKLPGKRLDEIWDSLSKEEKIQVTKEIGKLLAKIHSIKLDHFGLIEEEGKIDYDKPFKFKKTGEPMPHSPFLRNLLKDYLKDLARLISYKHLPPKFSADYLYFICNNLDTLDYEGKPVLCHNDYMTGHLFVEKQSSDYKIVGLIDFELATSSAPIIDFIKLHRQGFFFDKELKKALEEGYGPINERGVEVLRIMRDICFAQVLFESGDRELATKILNESEKKIKLFG